MTSSTIEKKSSKAAEKARRNASAGTPKGVARKPTGKPAPLAHVFQHGEAWLLTRPDGTVLAQAGSKRKASWRARQFDIVATGIVDGAPEGFNPEAPRPPSPETAELRALTASAPAKSKSAAAEPKEPRAKRVSALDAAAIVLGKAKAPMTAQAMIDEMAAKGLWKSPGGATPSATLYAAMVREINGKGAQSRFRKADKGLFAAA